MSSHATQINGSGDGSATHATALPPPSHRAISSSKRVIMHVDMDSYYAQCERERFPHFRNKPLAVVQQGTFVVTSNYRCRARGLPKSWYLNPEIDRALAAASSNVPMSSAEAAAVAASSTIVPSVDAASGICTPHYSGSSMDRYRAMCRVWMSCFERFEGGKVTLMRRGIDECLLDLTALALERARKGIVKIHAYMSPEDRQSQESSAQARFAHAEHLWRAAESTIPEYDRESSGRLAPAMKASVSKDPMTTSHGIRLGGMPNPWVTTVTVVAPATGAKIGVRTSDGPNTILSVPPELKGKTEEEIEAYCNEVHPEDFCRASRDDKGPTKLYAEAELSKNGAQPVAHSPWCGHVLLSGWSDQERSLPDEPQDGVQTMAQTSSAVSGVATLPGWDGAADVTADGEAEEDETDQERTNTAAPSSITLFPPPSNIEHCQGDLTPVLPFLPLPGPTNDPSHELLLLIGSQIAFELRSALFAETGLTSSACVAPNPMLAKMCSSVRKPNQQSILRPSTVKSFLRTMKLKAVPGFGPKAQARAGQHGLWHIAQVQQFPSSHILEKTFGTKFGSEIWDIGQGVDETIVKTLPPPKSMAQEKSKRVRDGKDLLAQATWLAEQLGPRLKDHEEFYRQVPANLNLYWREYQPPVPPGVPKPKRRKGSRTVLLPRVLYASADNPWAELVAAASSLVEKHLASFPPGTPFVQMSNVGLSITAWKDGAEDEKKSMIKFLVKEKPDTIKTEAAHTNVPSTSGSTYAAIADATPTDMSEEDDLLTMLDARDAAAPPPAVPSTAASPTFICHQCQASILITQQSEHADYHFALEWQSKVRAEDRREREKELEAQSHAQKHEKSSKSKRVPGSSIGPVSVCPSIQSFFKPKH